MSNKKNWLIALILLLGAAPASARDPFGVERKIAPPPTACPVFDASEPLRAADVVLLALCRNPQSRRLYMGALATAAEYGRAKAGDYPTLDFSAGVKHSDARVRKGGNVDSTAATAGLTFGWLLYDSGGREAAKKSALRALDASLATRSDILQSLVFDTLEAYYAVFSARRGKTDAEEKVASAASAYAAASKRFELGLVALSDKLQAETALAQARLDRTKADETLAVADGKLAVLLDLPPSTILNLRAEKPPSDAFSLPRDIDGLIKNALENRADIRSKRAEIKQAEADEVFEKSKNSPKIALSAGLNVDKELIHDKARATGGNVGVSLNVPLFTGFENTYGTKGAAYRLEQKRAELKAVENTVREQVWTAWQGFAAARKSLEVSLTMFASADQNARVSLGAYKAGKSGILDVLDAQAKLADARSVKTRAFYDVLTARAKIARVVGLIDPFSLNTGFSP